MSRDGPPLVLGFVHTHELEYYNSIPAKAMKRRGLQAKERISLYPVHITHCMEKEVSVLPLLRRCAIHVFRGSRLDKEETA